ncbi:MAG: hypothetical protein GC178_01475 [Flavobacteriales bacterium]|nr:hypothetical protein [Flavobacteriales bacterium]
MSKEEQEHQPEARPEDIIEQLTKENQGLKQQVTQMTSVLEEQAKQLQLAEIIEKVTPVFGQIGKSLADLFNPKWWKYAFDLATILAVVIPICILGYTENITDCTLGTLFGSIIGYALARFRKGIE